MASALITPPAHTACSPPATHPQPPGRATDQQRRPPLALAQCADLASASAWLNSQLGRCRRQACPAGLLWVQLQPDAAGLAGPLVRVLGQRLRHRVRATDQLMQVGHDAFIVLLLHVSEPTLRLVQQRLEAVLREPVDHSGSLAMPPVARLGHALLGRDGEQAATLLRAMGAMPPGA